MGVELARANPPSVIIMDINLPGMSGLDAVRILKGWEETVAVPVIALTAAASLGTRSARAPVERTLSRSREPPMLHYAAVFLVIALIAALFGFGGIAASSAGIAKILFFVFVVLAVVSLLFGRRVKA